jgi:hypothetical protein
VPRPDSSGLRAVARLLFRHSGLTRARRRR